MTKLVFSADLYPLILLPDECVCTECRQDLITDSRPSSLSVYTNTGILNALNYHKSCRNCRKRFYYSYISTSDGRRTYRPHLSSQDYFVITSQTAFEIAYLRSISDLIDGGAVSFTAASECYQTTTGVEMERQRLEEAYFLWRLLEVYMDNGVAFNICERDTSFHLDLDKMCADVLDSFHLTDEFVNHKCDSKGCSEGFLMADGIEKVSQLSNSKCRARMFQLMTFPVCLCTFFRLLSVF